MATKFDPTEFVRSRQQRELFQELNWSGSFEEYVNIVLEQPQVTRTAFQRIYDMILSHGVEEYVEFKKKINRYRFFDDPFENGADGIFGLEVALMKMVSFFKAAAQRYGPEKRVLLLHGPVGSCKSTIARLLKKGLEQYSRTREGALYTFAWKLDLADERWEDCPMHEEPLHLVPAELRAAFLNELSAKCGQEIFIEGNPIDENSKKLVEEMKKDGARITP